MSDLQAAAPAKVQLTVSGILNDLNEGLTRDGIRGKYSLTAKDVQDLFKHPKLKGKKTKPAPSFELIDDTADVVEEVVAPIDEGTVTGEADEAPTTEENMEVQEEF